MKHCEIFLWGRIQEGLALNISVEFRKLLFLIMMLLPVQLCFMCGKVQASLTPLLLQRGAG